MSVPLATVGILSIGDMGMGVAKLLLAHHFRVVTNAQKRSPDTHARIQNAQIETVASDVALVETCDYILSIVPPRNALSTAQRISRALSVLPARAHPLYYLDLNAISPRSARIIATLFPDPAIARLVDGGIVGGPPKLKSTDDSVSGPSTNVSSHAPSNAFPDWSRPAMPVSGPYELADAPLAGAALASTLNIKHIADTIGPASGLKCCFATTTKGFTALAIQAFTTADALGVLPELRALMADAVPAHLSAAERGVTSMPPKAYRWVREMQEIGTCHADEGGFAGAAGSDAASEDGEPNLNIFDVVANVYQAVAEDTLLGQEKTERRKRGRTVEDVASLVGEGLRAKRERRA